MAYRKLSKLLMISVIMVVVVGLPWGCDNTQPDPETGDQASNVDDDDDISDVSSGFPIVADHTVVPRYIDIPQEYIDIVKTWLVDAAGESHSEAYRDGIMALARAHTDPEFELSAQTFSSGFPTSVTTALRLGSHAWVGEGAFWTNTAARDAIKNLVADQHDANNPIDVIFQGWCYDFTRDTHAAGDGTDAVDEEYNVSWFGSSVGGPDGDHIWGLDSSDFEITGNRVSLQTYFHAIEDYNDYFETNHYVCRAVYTTGPVDGGSAGGEAGYQRYIKHEAIRDHVRASDDRVLFDYADILCYNDSGSQQTTTWTYENEIDDIEIVYTFPTIHTDNDGNDTGHIGNAGALRLAKAMWWMLARMAGWDGLPQTDSTGS